MAWNMSEAKHFAHAMRVAPRSDVIVLLTCFGLTVIFDMLVSVTAGVLLAALLFMRRMAEVSNVRLVDQHPIATQGLPKDVLIYEVAGPLFFGAAQKAMSALQRVPTAVARLHQLGMFVVLGGVQGQPLRVLARSGIREHRDRIAVHRTMERAVATAIGRSRAARAVLP